MKRVVLKFVRVATGSVVQIEIKKPANSRAFAFFEEFNGFVIRSETHYENLKG
jgi:hypothetical protein